MMSLRQTLILMSPPDAAWPPATPLPWRCAAATVHAKQPRCFPVYAERIAGAQPLLRQQSLAHIVIHGGSDCGPLTMDMMRSHMSTLTRPCAEQLPPPAAPWLVPALSLP